jgi:hypothetical protein
MSDTMLVFGIDWFKPDRPSCNWPMIQEANDGFIFRSANGIDVIISGQIEDGKRWLHVSLSRKHRMPTYEDIALVKRAFIGDGLKAIMIFPERKYHVNLHSFCLHLWACLEDDQLPKFSHGLGTI